MAKTKEELNIIRKEIEIMNKKLQELTDEELKQVTGGVGGNIGPVSKDKNFGLIDQQDDEDWLGYKKKLGSDKPDSEIR